uniref:Uncharacterized protein n=1 Tax=Romanomermis culicivorax TaxID=13658 RepID=A0A915HV22_ROMCU
MRQEEFPGEAKGEEMQKNGGISVRWLSSLKKIVNRAFIKVCKVTLEALKKSLQDHVKYKAEPLRLCLMLISIAQHHVDFCEHNMVSTELRRTLKMLEHFQYWDIYGNGHTYLK